MSGTLFVVATPIGNLEDLTRRAERALRDAHTVVAEDTRRTRALLAHLGATGKPLRRLDANADAAQVEAVARVVAEGHDVAMVTDAGTPSISDPGSKLVAAVRALGGTIVPLPGPSAVTAALSACGFELSGYRFAGFLPRSGMERARALARIAEDPDAVVLFESPNRLAETLRELAQPAPARRALVAREITKLHEELLEATLSELCAQFEGREVLGEITIVLAPHEAGRRELSDEEVLARIDAALASGMRAREVAERVALESGRSKKQIYDWVLARK